MRRLNLAAPWQDLSWDGARLSGRASATIFCYAMLALLGELLIVGYIGTRTTAAEYWRLVGAPLAALLGAIGLLAPLAAGIERACRRPIGLLVLVPSTVFVAIVAAGFSALGAAAR